MKDDLAIDWATLQHTAGPIPVGAIEAAIKPLGENPSLLKELIDRYKIITAEPYVVETFEYAYIPYIVVKAASNLAKEVQLEIGQWLVDSMWDACALDDEYLMDFLLACIFQLGQAALPAIAKAMDDKLFDDTAGEWFHIWGVAELARESTDLEMRERFAQRAMRTLEACASGDCDPNSASPAGWLAAGLGYSAAIPIIEKIIATQMGSGFTDGMGIREFEFALKAFHGDPIPAIDRRELMPLVIENKESLEKWYKERPADWNEFDAFDDEFEEGFDEDDRKLARELPDILEDYKPRILERPFLHQSAKIGRNDPCPCGSGKKYKKCCGG